VLACVTHWHHFYEPWVTAIGSLSATANKNGVHKPIIGQAS